MAVTPNGAYAYVTNFGSNSVSVISTATTASPSPTIPEFPAQLLIITLVVFMITGLSAVIIAKKRITRRGKSPWEFYLIVIFFFKNLIMRDSLKYCEKPFCSKIAIGSCEAIEETP